MSLSFQKVVEVLRSYDLRDHLISNGRTEFSFANRQTSTGKRNVVTQVKPQKNGGVNGYIFVDMLEEYQGKTTKLGHISIKHMTETELRNIIEKVVKHYR
jgi:triosephosphate isomerase